MTTVNNTKPVTPSYPSGVDAPAPNTEVTQPTAPGAAGDAKVLPKDFGAGTDTGKVGSAPQLTPPKTEALTDANIDDLMLLVQGKKDQNKEVQKNNFKQILSNADALLKANLPARLELMNNAVKGFDNDLFKSIVNYAVKNPQQLLAFAVGVAGAIGAAVATGGASIPASLVTLVGQASPIVNGVLSEAGINLKELIAKTAESVLIWAGVPPEDAYKYAAISTSVLMLAADIGMSALSGGQYRPNPALVGAVAEDVFKALNFSIGGAETLGATVTSLASVSIALGFGIAAGGASYGGIDKIWGAAEKVGASVVSGLGDGKLDIAKILQEAGPIKDLFAELAKQINSDSGGSVTQLWAGMEDSFSHLAQYVENAITPAPVQSNRGYA
jgi:hypothetical protein